MSIICAMPSFTANGQETASHSQVLVLKKKGNKYGFADEKGKIVIPYKYLYAEEFSEGLALVGKKNSGYGFINKEGKEIIPCQYNQAKSFSDGLAAVFKATERMGNMMIGRWGFINTEGTLVIPYQYRVVTENFHNGTAKVDGGIIIDKTGNKVE